MECIVTFKISEEKRIRVKSIDFFGNYSFADKELKKFMVTKTHFLFFVQPGYFKAEEFDADIDRMVKESELHADEDKKRREEVEMRNAADTLAYTAEKTLREHGDKLSDDLKQRVEQALSKLRTALDGSDSGEIERTMGELSEAVQQVGTEVYQAQQPPPAGEEPPAEGPAEGDEGTVEGEFREV